MVHTGCSTREGSSTTEGKEDMDAKELLDEWMYSSIVPSPKTFRATSDEPVREVLIGRLEDGSEVWAFGVVYYDWTFDGGPTTNQYWAWYLNRRDALRRQLVEAYRYSDMARTWMFHRPETQDECLRLERREIGAVDGEAVIVYRYPMCERGRPTHWRIGCDEKEARRRQRCALWYFSGSKADPALEYPDPEDPNAQIPEIVQCAYGTCAETGQALVRYGMFRDDEYSYETSWFETLEYAQDARAKAQERFRVQQAHCQLRRDQKIAEAVHMEVRRQEDELRALSWYDAVRTMVDPSIVAAYDALYLEWPEPGKVDPVEHVAECRTFAAAVEALRNAIEAAYLNRAVACEEHQLQERVTALLDHWYPTCPLCGEKYQRGDFETVLVTGELLITGCGCPERGWDDRTQDAPAIVNAVHKARRMCLHRDHLPELRNGALHNGRDVTTISAVQYRGVVLARFVLVYYNLSLQPALLIDTNAWLQLPSGSNVAAQCAFDPVWERVTLPAVRREEYRYAEERVEAGTVRKIAFQLGEQSGRWYADVQDACGWRRFVVDPQRCNFPIQAGVLYYCQVDSLPDNWRPRMTEYVRPYLAVPLVSQRDTALRRTEARQPSRTPQASKSKGGFGTFADLLQEKLTR